MQDRLPPARRNPLATHGRTIHWVNRVILVVGRLLPVFPWKRTSLGPVAMSQRCPQLGSCTAINRSLFDHLVGAREQRRRHGEADGFRGLETRAAAPTFSFGKRGIPVKQEALLISDWQRQCPRPMVQMKPVTQPADCGEGAIPYCWPWRLDFLFLAPQRAHCIMRCSR